MNDLRSLVEQAAQLCQSHRCEEAIGALEQAVHLGQRNPVLHYQLGYCYSGGCCEHSFSDPDIALLHLRPARSQASASSDPLLLARILDAMGNVFPSVSGLSHQARSEAAIDCHSQAAALYRELGMPEDWAREQFSQANAWCELTEEEYPEKWEQAVGLYKAALRVRTKDKTPELYAATMQNLGAAYRELRSDDREHNVRNAIHCYHEALRVRSATSARLKAAVLHHNLGNAFLTLAEVEKGREIRHAHRALRHFDHALKVYSRSDHPCDYAKTQLSRGQTYILLARHGSEAHRQAATLCLSEARECFSLCRDAVGLQNLPSQLMVDGKEDSTAI
jgi:tetratricopeptide (TPR) repeat protein